MLRATAWNFFDFRTSKNKQGQGGGWCGKSKRPSSNLPIFFLLGSCLDRSRAESALQSGWQECKRRYGHKQVIHQNFTNQMTFEWTYLNLLGLPQTLTHICGRLPVCRISWQQSFHVVCQMRQTLRTLTTMTTSHVCWWWVTLDQVLIKMPLDHKRFV